MSGRYGFCKCGCGERTRLAPYSRSERGWTRGEPIDFIAGHQQRGKYNPQWKGGKHARLDGYVQVWEPDHPHARSDGYVFEHVMVAVEALGKPLPDGAIVHHHNEDRGDNRPENLVICEDRAYHNLLHQRMRALEACGNPDWLPCGYCGEYDDPASLTVPAAIRQSAYHKACKAADVRQRKAERAAAEAAPSP